MEYLPYTYLIGWSSLDKWYYGVEYSYKRVANPNNLWSSYYTSSKTVKVYREEFGEPDVVQVRKTFSTGTDDERRNKSQRFEKKVLQRLNVTASNRWLNESVCGNGNTKHPQWVRMKISRSLKGREFTEEWKAKLKVAKQGKNHPNYGKKRSDETKRKSSESNRGQTRSAEARVKMSAKAKERCSTPLICPHCGKEGFGGNIYRYHFNNCKFKTE